MFPSGSSLKETLLLTLKLYSMTQILNSQVTARLELEKIGNDYYHLIIMKSRSSTIIVITEAEAQALINQLNLLPRKTIDATEKNS